MSAAHEPALGRKKAVAAVWNSLLHNMCQNLMAAALVGLTDWWYFTYVHQTVALAEVKTMLPTFIHISKT